MPLTQIAIKNAKAAKKPLKLFDGGGLYLLIQPSGGKWWRYKYRFAGKEKLLALGSYPDVSLAQARESHVEARKTLAEGNDPSEVKKEEKRLTIIKHENSFEVAAREWHSKRSRAWTPKYTASIMRRLEADIFPKLGNRPIAEITPPEILSVLRFIEARGAHDLAHRVQQICGQIFTYAIVTGRAERNPVNDLRGALTPVTKKHNAYLKAEDLPEFLAKMNAYDGVQTRLAMKFLLLTFVRTGEMRGALWSEIDMAKAEWRIPAERMKMRDPHIVPLSRQALAVLEELKPLTGHWQHVFPNQHKPMGQMSENTILYALYRMGYHGRSTGHGFRATASTILNEHGFKPDVIERQLAHAERNGVRKAYNHAQYLPERRKMMQWWADYLEERIV
ncbi:MAG: tyrosine-type recombinase/integrase [Alphaproteobacteria bacterium]|jgi:integrase